MSRAIRAIARLAKVRQDLARARAAQVAAELNRARQLSSQVQEFAAEYSQAAMQAGMKGISVAMLTDTLAFKERLLDTAQEQQVFSAELAKRAAVANQAALAAKMKHEGFERILKQRSLEEARKAELREWREIEDSIGQRTALGLSRAGTKDA
jgi:flagellar biosynthesis chaperone FliJ